MRISAEMGFMPRNIGSLRMKLVASVGVHPSITARSGKVRNIIKVGPRIGYRVNRNLTSFPVRGWFAVSPITLFSKYELVYHHRFATLAQARTAIFD